MRLPSLLDIAQFTATVSLGSFIGGSIAGTVGVISKYVLPKLGFHNVCGILITTISRYAFTAAVVCFSTFAFLSLAMLAVAICMPPIRCGGDG